LPHTPDPALITRHPLLLIGVSPINPAANLTLLRNLRERANLPMVLVVPSTNGSEAETLYHNAGFELLDAAASLGETRAVLRLALV
ncbi:MAG TPA: hypothetical protein PKX00_19070, partial [Opitutaceae bacterium]|nr:hypothetical protein [Opitutaceae bacterium]